MNLFEEVLAFPSAKEFAEYIKRTYNCRTKEDYKREMWQALITNNREETLRNIRRYDPLTLIREFEKIYKK